LQQKAGPEPINDDGSLFKLLPSTLVVFFCKNSPPFNTVVMQRQPISTQSALQSRESSGPAAPRASVKARIVVNKVATKNTLTGKHPSRL
jgi:hypothetical protein